MLEIRGWPTGTSYVKPSVQKGNGMRYYTPLRYPGGKGRLAGFMKDLIQHNNLSEGTYIEPYAGGAAVALTLLIEEYAWRVVINDFDPLIYAFWHSVLYETEDLLKMLHDTPVKMKQWHEQRAIHKAPDAHSTLEVGFATLFMNRTNRSGIIKAGVIGGKDQNGPYLIDARFNKKNLAERIERIAQYKNRITLLNRDAMDVITDESLLGNGPSIIYLDPPYYNKGSLLYSNFYKADDHADIAESVKALSTPWILTYDSVPEVHELYEGEDNLHFTLTYSANKTRQKGTEVMFYGGVQIPPPYDSLEPFHFKKN